ncbi:RagB/SusD family nutrient uptake outer membrane protein [Chryseobacterium phosphatilyticum]|uniref:RagB/SusD family nutrient uptake outer membrane protein n=1 Tax=Chryseobacterium phosphatilyticum TaxID=475075 RepID=A0A316XEB0_9FLAO|nr:RagB/SusD family nutrient uptake outer membrane protein [Chryseobacterium phosphatilyticum]PWN70553.1 RagB/SusD family nutrient uptake outer membrane protein [Chryseobacterium phosphatilyticum]
MKRIINITILSFALFSFIECSDDRFDVLPNNQDSPQTIFTTESNYRVVVDGAYDAFKSATYYSGDTGSSIILGDVLADNLILNTQGRQTNKVAYEWSFTPQSSDVTALYSSAYFVISRANLVLDNLNKVPYTNYMRNIEAEAKAIRAIAHFDLVRAYAKIPTQSADASSSLGIAYVTTFNPAIKPVRDTSVIITYDKIIADLLDALSKINSDNGSIGRLNRTSILGFLSRVYLYKGDYNKAIEYGEQCISAYPSVGSKDNFVNVWRDASDDGELFTILNSNVSADNVNVGVAYSQDVSGIRSEHNVNYDLFTKYQDIDIRKTAYVLTANFGSTPYNHVIKYRTRNSSTVRGVVDIKFLRSAEVYLNVAEAYIKSSAANPTRALQLLNILRTQRYTSYVAGTETGTDLLNAIYYERRLELAFENDRFWTIKRLGQSVIRSSFGSAANGGGTDAPTGSLKTLPANSFRFVLPIPQDAINLNPNMLQNPGY